MNCLLLSPLISTRSNFIPSSNLKPSFYIVRKLTINREKKPHYCKINQYNYYITHNLNVLKKCIVPTHITKIYSFIMSCDLPV